MPVCQTFITDGNEFTFITGSTTAFGTPVNRRIPQDILFPFHDTFDIRLQVIVFMDGYGRFEITDIKEIGKIMFTAKLGVLRGGNDILQYFPLGIEWIILPGFDTPEPRTGKG